PTSPLFPYTTLFRSAVHLDDPEFKDFTSIKQLPPHRFREIKRFFEDYKLLENKEVVVDQVLDEVTAKEVIVQALKDYRTHFKSGDRKSTRLNSSHVK